MYFADNYENLLNQMNFKREDKKVKHNINKNSPLLPFKSREPERVVFDNGFYNILGEFARIQLDKTAVDGLDLNSVVTGIVNSDKLEKEPGSEKYLEKLLKEYLFNNNDELKLLNPYLFLYIPLSNNKRSVGEKDLALFFRDIFCKDNMELKEFFENKGSNHIIIDLILQNISKLPDNSIDSKFICVLDYIVDLFNEDISFALKNEKFLMENMANIFAYYYFFYITQLILKLNKGFNASLDENEELFYLLDWEGISKNRKTLNYGYKFVKDMSNPLFAEVSVIDQLNTLCGTKGLLLPQLYDYFEGLDSQSQENLIYYLKKWVEDYREVRGFINPQVFTNDFKQLIKILLDSLDDDKLGVAQATVARYSKNLEEIARSYFIKRRGSYGFVLNINMDMLLLLTALCVKDEKIKLKQLFEEYERRGLYFDRYSKEKIVDFLTKLNLIDKKSDSGDAQYVKPVL